jgi:hypothetical protein
MNKLNPNKIQASTQKYLDIAEMVEDTVVLKDGTIRGVLLVSSVNFALKSQEEQEAIIANYANFLNTLDFSIQIVIQSRKLNIDKYLAKVKSLQNSQMNELLKIQTAEYVEYIKELVELEDIMSKQFYIIVPYSAATDKKKGWLNKMGEALAPTTTIRLKRKKFLEYQEGLGKRLAQVSGALSSMGIASIRLNTQSLIELYYRSYNPLEAQVEKMVEVERLQVE